MTPIKFLDGSPITESMATPLPPPPEQTAATGKRLTSGLMQTLAHLNLSRVIQGFAAFLVILLWGTTLYEIRAERHLAITTSYRDSANLARAFEEHTIRTLKSVDQAVLFLKFQYEKYGDKINIADYVGEGMIISTIFPQLGVIDEHGIYILSNLPNFKKVDLSDRPHFLVHQDKDTNELFVSKPVLGRASGKWSIQMTRRINKKDGAFGGVVVISVDPFYFSSFYSGVNLGKNGLVTLVGKDGVVRARRAGEDTTVGQDISKGAFFQQLRTGVEGNFETSSSIDHVSRYYSYREVKGYPFYVIVGVAEDEALADYRERRTGYLIFASAVSLAILAFTTLIIALVRRQQRIAENLRESQIRAESANRMKSEFLASMSHELRTPLNGILGYAEYLRDDARDDTQKEFATTILASGDHLLGLVNSVLDLAKIEAGRMELMEQEESLPALLQEALSAHRKSAQQKGLALTLECAEDVPERLSCDRPRLGQVLQNLLHNAIKFTDRGSVTLLVAREGDALRFEIRDTGCGIPLEAQAHIFERFRQGDAFVTRRHGGTGLGLALAQELVSLMGGRIDLESTPGAGTHIWFLLPERAAQS